MKEMEREKRKREKRKKENKIHATQGPSPVNHKNLIFVKPKHKKMKNMELIPSKPF